ncbi:MAG: glycosyl transferase [Rhizobium sp.]|nr:glycosyl transferase [Rhizobium sp.]
MKSERPFKRSIVKLAAAVFFGKGWAHAQNWIPGLELRIPPTQQDEGAVVLRGERVAALHHADLLRKAAHETIHIVGSGPSIAGVDFSRIAPGEAILLNGAINLAGTRLGSPLAVAIEDERFVWRHFSLMREKIGAGAICLLSVGVIRAICGKDRAWLADKRVILIDDVRRPYRVRRRSDEDLRHLDFTVLADDGAGFSRDPSRGVFQGGSVAVSALQFAAFCRPGIIGLFGIDISNAGEPRFYEKAGDTAGSGIAGAAGRIVAHFALARRVCLEDEIQILNFSPVSALIGAGFPYDPRFAAAKAATA